VKISKTSAEDSEGDAINMLIKSELRGILDVAAGRWRPLIVTATFTGMRASELRALKWIDVDLKEGVIHVRRRVDHWRSFGAPKSKAGRRRRSWRWDRATPRVSAIVFTGRRPSAAIRVASSFF
jgi:integrase